MRRGAGRGRARTLELLVKNLFFTLLVPGTVAVYLPISIAGSEPDAATDTTLLRVLAFAAFVVGGSVYAWCVWDFASFGRGTPAPIDPPRKLVVRGLYRYSRNPMYVGVVTVLLGWAAWFGDATLVLYAGGVATCFQLFVMLYEEPHLRGEFGAEYEAYCARVGRWLPRLRGAGSA